MILFQDKFKIKLTLHDESGYAVAVREFLSPADTSFDNQRYVDLRVPSASTLVKPGQEVLVTVETVEDRQ